MPPITRRAALTQVALRTISAAAAGSLFAEAHAAPAPMQRAKPSGGAVVLDDCDPRYDGKETYEDNLTFVSGSGKVRARVSGLNVCEEVGSPNRVAIDAARQRVWVAETVGNRLLQYDLDGKERA